MIIEKSAFGDTHRHVLYLLCMLLFMFAGCHYRDESGGALTDAKITFDRIAVVPFQYLLSDEATGEVARCPLCEMAVNATPSAENAEAIVERLFLEQLDKKAPKLNVIAGERVAGTFRRISSDSLRNPLRQVLREVGNELGVEGVVAGYVYRFRERKGVSYTVEHPASVGFDIHLLRVSDGALVWRGHFDKTQSSLMEDLLQIVSFYRGKGRWVTAEELAGEGLERVLSNFPAIP